MGTVFARMYVFMYTYHAPCLVVGSHISLALFLLLVILMRMLPPIRAVLLLDHTTRLLPLSL